jgi:hypothetical protein
MFRSRSRVNDPAAAGGRAAGRRHQWKRPWALQVAAAIGLVVAAPAGLVSFRSGQTVATIVQSQIVGIAYLLAGAIAWRRRPNWVDLR